MKHTEPRKPCPGDEVRRRSDWCEACLGKDRCVANRLLRVIFQRDARMMVDGVCHSLDRQPRRTLPYLPNNIACLHDWGCRAIG